MKFSSAVWQKIQPIYHEILEHPFNKELESGVLENEKFLYYLNQDSSYLIAFSRALAGIAGRANQMKTVEKFLEFSHGALIAERKLHQSFLDHESNDSKPPSPACFGYTQYLIATAATASIEEAIAAILPCFWIYREIGRKIVVHAKKDNPYIRWIDAYSDNEFHEITESAIGAFDEIADAASFKTQEAMSKAFEYSCLFEWHFWDDAYHLRSFCRN